MIWRRLQPGHAGHLVVGLVVWSIWFVVLYSGLSIGCRFAPPAAEQGVWNWLNGTLLVLAFIFMGLLLRGAYVSWRHTPSAESGESRQRFLSKVSAAVYLVAALASLAISLPSLALPPCV